MLITEACTNAVTHARPDSTVDVTVIIDDHDCVLEVGNQSSHIDGARITADLPDPLTKGRTRAAADRGARRHRHVHPDTAGQVLLRITKQMTGKYRTAPARAATAEAVRMPTLA